MAIVVPPIEFVPITPLPPLTERERIRAAVETVLAMQEMGDDMDVSTSDEDEAVARHIFKDGREITDVELARPGVVLKLQALLDEYDYGLIADANKIRNYVINKLVEETSGPNASNRLRALELLGKVTEVNAFTERKQIEHVQKSTEEMQNELREVMTVLLSDDEVEVLRAPAKPAVDVKTLAARAQAFSFDD